MAKIQRQIDTQSQSTTSATQVEKRERMTLGQFVSDIVRQSTGEVVGKGLILTHASHLAENDEHKETVGGLLANFVDPVSHKRSWFLNDAGQRIEGGCPVRLFSDDAAALADQIGTPGKGTELVLFLEPEADAAVYRKEDGTVAFLALRLEAVRSAGYRRMATKVVAPVDLD